MTHQRRHHRPGEHPGIPNFQGKKIVLASDVNIRRLQPYVDQVLECLGYAEALVTDMSIIHDFPVRCEHDRDHDVDDRVPIELVGESLGVEVKCVDYIWEVADRLAKKDHPG